MWVGGRITYYELSNSLFSPLASQRTTTKVGWDKNSTRY